MHSHETSSFPFRIQEILMLGFGFLVITFLIYGVSLSQPFVVLDDPFVIYNNLAIRSITPATLKQIFTTYDPELYIPFTFLSFQLNYLIGGLSPFSYHLGNLVLHALNALTVTMLFTTLLRNKPVSILAGLLFALHPLNTEVVMWATARKEALSGFFFLLSILLYLRANDGQRKTYVASVIMFLFALLSKVTVFTLPLILLLIDWLQEKPMNRKTILKLTPFVVLSVIFVAIGILPKERILSSTTFIEKILMAGKSSMFYLTKFLIPTDLSILYPNQHLISLSSPEFPIAVTALLLLITAVLASVRRTRKIAFGFGFFLILLSPTLVHFNRNASIQSGSGTGIQFASDHYVYLPQIGLLYLVAMAVLWLWNQPRRTVEAKSIHAFLGSVLALIVCTFGALAFRQSFVWQSSETLFLHTLSIYPYSAAARVNLSVIYRKTGRFEEEKKVLQDGLVFGDNQKLYSGLGAIAVREFNVDEAKKHYEAAMRTDPTSAEPYFGLGTMYATQGKNTEALAAYAKAVAMDPEYVAAYNNIGSLLLAAGNEADAEKHFRTAVTLNRSFREGFFNLGALYASQAKFTDAKDAFEQALALEPDSIDTRLELVPVYLELGQNSNALEQIRVILAIDPKNTQAKALVKEMIRLGILG